MYVAVSASIAAMFLFLPTAVKNYEENVKRGEQARYSTGLSPCEDDWKEFSEYIDSHLPGLPEVSIDEFPSFSNAQAVRVVGQEIFFFRVNGKSISRGTYQRADTFRSAISPEASAGLLSLVTREIDNARAEQPLPIDGTIYVFRSARTNRCAKTISLGGTRADRLVDLYYSTIRYTTGSPERPVDERGLQRQIDSLLSD